MEQAQNDKDINIKHDVGLNQEKFNSEEYIEGNKDSNKELDDDFTDNSEVSAEHVQDYTDSNIDLGWNSEQINSKLIPENVPLKKDLNIELGDVSSMDEVASAGETSYNN